MTQPVGSEAAPSEEGIMPWAKQWTLKATQAISDGADSIRDAVVSVKMPWEKKWEEKGRPTAPVQKAAPEAPKPLPGDKFETVFASLIQAESKGQHTDSYGKLTTSNVGAKGITQVMMKTGVDPGYGVAPLKDQSEKEYIRFGRDYLKAMLNEFDNDYPKALAAYNAGVGNVKKAITAGGDKWKDHLPKKSETLPYIDKILGKNK